MHLNDLPSEILSLILSQAHPLGTRYNCLLVSRRFYQLMLPELYRSLSVEFIIQPRLVTLIRTVRRNAHLREFTRSLCLGEDPTDSQRTLERVIGSNDINKLFPFFTKIEIFAMTFERTMLYRFFAYCARADCLEELVVHYPDLVPLMQPIKGLKRLSWGLTSSVPDSPVLGSEEGKEETRVIQRRFLESLGRFTPLLETIVIGCLGREADYGIQDRVEGEVFEGSASEVVIPQLEKLTELEWRVGEGKVPAAIWKEVIEGLTESHKEQLETVKWDCRKWHAAELQLREGPEGIFFDRLGSMSSLKNLEIAFGPFDFEITPLRGLEWVRTQVVQEATTEFYESLQKWHMKSLQTLKLRFSVIGGQCDGEVRLLKELNRAENLRSLEMTFGVPARETWFVDLDEEVPQDAKALTFSWYHNVDKMTEVLNNLPSSLEAVFIDFDGQHDVYDKYRTYAFSPRGDIRLMWKDELRATVRDYVQKQSAIDKKVLFNRLPKLKTVYIGGYELI